MVIACSRRLLRLIILCAAVLALTLPAAWVAAESGQTWEQQNHKGAQYVQIALGETNQESGLRLLEGQPDGLTATRTEQSGRLSQPNATGTERFFYFEVHDTYVSGGANKVTLTITYKDVGLTPIFLEYDAFDWYRPAATVDELAKKRVPVVTRGNTDGWKTAFVTVEDARFLGGQPGGADFRIGSTDELVLSNVALYVMSHADAPRPVRVTLDGKEVAFDPNEVQPFIHPSTSRTLVPFRALFNALGISNESIVWHNETRTVEARRGTTVMLLPIDADVATVNGKPIKLDQPAVIVAGRTVVPLRFVTEQFGLDVAWEAGEHKVVLTTRPVVPPGPVTPGTTPPGTTSPGTTQPGTTQPGTTQPGTTQPGPTTP